MSDFIESTGSDAAVSTELATEETYTAPDTEPIGAEPETDALDGLPDEQPVYAQFDTQLLPEPVRPVYEALHNDYTTASQFKTEAEPIVSWVQERGGREAIEQDIALLDKAFSPDPDTRNEFFSTLFEQSPSALQHLISDLAETEYMTRQIVAQLQKDPERASRYGVRFGGVEEAAEDDVAEPDFLTEMGPQFRELFKTFPKAVQEDYAARSAEVAKFDLENAYRARQEQMRIEQDRQAQAQREQQERATRIEQLQQQTYQDTRKIVIDSLKEAFPGDDVLPELVAGAVETAYFDSAEGQAQWTRLSQMIANGEARAVKAELPIIIAQVKSIAAKKSQHLASIYADARKYRASQQTENPRTEPRPGETVGSQPAARVQGAGQYRPENILQYWEQGARR